MHISSESTSETRYGRARASKTRRRRRRFVCLRGVLSTRRLRNYKCSVAREREVLLVRATVVVVALLAAGEWSGAGALAVVRAREGGGSIHGDILFSHSRSSRRVSV